MKKSTGTGSVPADRRDSAKDSAALAQAKEDQRFRKEQALQARARFRMTEAEWTEVHKLTEERQLELFAILHFAVWQHERFDIELGEDLRTAILRTFGVCQ